MFSSTVNNQPKDFEVSPPPEDGVSCMSFSPATDWLAASSWDGKVKVWEIQPNGTTVPKTEINLEAPALTCAWAMDGSKMFSGGGARQGRLTDVATGQTIPYAEHDAPIKSSYFFNMTTGSPMQNVLVTGSWDKTLKYWDTRAPANTPLATVQLPERCYAMDVQGLLLTVATAEKHISVFNLNNPQTEFKRMTSSLKYQTRCISNFPNQAGFAIGSIEGRVSIQYIDDKKQSDNFSFRCHRDGNNVYAINAISFHPTFGTFSTAGSDGTFNYWDKDSKQRLKSFNNVGSPISTTCFNRDGRIFAYACSYDWSKGHEHYKQTDKNRILLQAVQEADIKGKGIRK